MDVSKYTGPQVAVWESFRGDMEVEGWDGEYESDCMTCGGDGYVYGADMDDRLWYDDDEIIRCPNCRGSGSASDQTFW